MRLVDLEPEWVYAGQEPGSFRRSDDNSRPQGILFACPFCFRKNSGLIGTHSILVWFADRDVPPSNEPLPRWTVASGTTFEDLTLTPSINLQNEHCTEEWHGWITNGEAIG
jgi:hypothetical protein